LRRADRTGRILQRLNAPLPRLPAMRLAKFCIALLAAGCTPMGGEQVQGWPALQVVEHHVPHHAMRERCSRYAGFGISPEACAEFDFAGKVCHIWFSTDFPPPAYVVAHERQHCLGYEHRGEHQLRNLLAQHGQKSPAAPKHE
jgi:hypothetical protein